MKKTSFAQSFSTTWTTLQGPKSLLNLMPSRSISEMEVLCIQVIQSTFYFPAASVLFWLLLYQLRSVELLWYQTSPVKGPWHQSCGSGPCVAPAAQTVSLQLLHWVPVGCKYSWMITITEKILLVHSSTGGASGEHSKSLQPEGSWAAVPLKSPWVSHGHLWE